MDAKRSPDAKGGNALWAFIMVFVMMWAGMIGTTLNTEPIQKVNLYQGLGLVCAVGIAAFLAMGRLCSWGPFTFPYSHLPANLAWHVFLLTFILFVCYLAFNGLVQISVLFLGAPLFDASCDKLSERDVALFVWEAMAKGAFKFLAAYLHLPTEACPPSRAGWTSTIAAQGIRWFTALVVVWYVFSFAKAWYAHLRTSSRC